MKTMMVMALVLAACGFAPRERAFAQTGSEDEGYRSYRDAYNLILEEKWEEAREKFAEMRKRFPRSEYLDDAEYWTAYSYRSTDHKKAVEAYKRFLKEYRNSSYFDDALADLDGLLTDDLVVAVPRRWTKTPDAPGLGYLYTPADSAAGLQRARAIPAPVIAPMLRVRGLERLLRGTRYHRGFVRFVDEDVDSATRLRVETLEALARTGEDGPSLRLLKGIALDPGEKQILRVTAIEALSNIGGTDVLPVFLEIAKSDTSEEMQLFAIEYIGDVSRDRDQAFDVLVDLYSSIPESKPEKKRMVFYSIAEVGGDRAVDFLARVARSADDYELRRDATYYLGSIGGEKARAVLIELLKEK